MPRTEGAEALFRLGPSPIHRRSFRPVREALGIYDDPPRGAETAELFEGAVAD